MSGRPSHVVVVGRDAPLWLTASALAEALLPTGVRVSAIELPSRLSPAAFHATLPAIESLHSRLGLDEAALLRVTRGSFSLGTNIVQPGHAPFFLAHGAYGAPIDGNDFFPYWLKGRRFGLGAQFEDFSPTAMAARNGRILIPDEHTELFGRTDYAYHLPAIAYAGLLKGLAARRGVTIHQAAEIEVELHSGSGAIRAIRPDGKPAIAGDLFVDTSGPEATLVGKALGIATQNWREFFPFDRHLLARANRFASVPTYAELRLSKDSWTGLYANQATTQVVHAYLSDEAADDAAAVNASAASELTLSDISILTSTPAVREKAWSRNCVAIGAAACTFDPIFDIDLHAVQLGIVHLLSLFPTTAEAASERDEYNRVTLSLFERLRDFQAALYLLVGASPVGPQSLKQKIDIFRARGTIAPMEDETFTPDQWRALFIGLGLAPESWSPTVDSTPPERVKEGFRRILGFVSEKVLEQPSHDHYLADIGADRTS